MFISVLDLFKIGIGPSSSHTMGPMVAAVDFIKKSQHSIEHQLESPSNLKLRITLKGSLAFTGKGHASDTAVALGVHGFLPEALAKEQLNDVIQRIYLVDHIWVCHQKVNFCPEKDIIFDYGEPLIEHPNGLIFELYQQEEQQEKSVCKQVYFSIGGGFIKRQEEMYASEGQAQSCENESAIDLCAYPFDSAKSMLAMSDKFNISISEMKLKNELKSQSSASLMQGIDAIWSAMQHCIENGLQAEGILPGKLNVKKRAKALYQDLTQDISNAELNDWLCAYAMAVNEENASGHMVVTAPTNGAAGVIPAVLYYLVKHKSITQLQIREFLLTAAAIGGLIKHRSSISGAEVGCQGEVGSAASMAAAGLCSVLGGSAQQIENAAEIALEHHMGMTCDPVGGLVQVPCIERNGFGAIKAYTAASLALRGSGEHVMSLDSCIAAMKQTGQEMSDKFKETSLGGLAVSWVEC